MTRDRLLALSFLVAAIGCGLRLWIAAPTPASYDEVGFLLALQRYDLLAFEPHFPGYPLAVWLARGAAAGGAATPYCAAVCVLLVLSTPLAHAGGGRGWGGVLAVGVLALVPLAVLEGARPVSDALATVLLTGGLAGALAGRVCLAGLGLGLAAAAKPDVGLFLSAGVALCADAPRGRRWTTGLTFLAGALPPLGLAFLAVSAGAGGPSALVHEALRFVGGHLTEWGGGVGAQPAQARLPLAVTPLVALGPHPGPLIWPVAAGALALARRAPQRLRRGAILTALPYGLWYVFGQNLAHPRHALPLLPVVAILLGLGLQRLRVPASLRGCLVAALLTGAACGSLAYVYARRARGRPVDRLEAWLTQRPGRFRLYAGPASRPLRYRSPTADVRPARSVAGVWRDLAADPTPPAAVWVTSELDDAGTLPLLADLGELRVHLLSPPSRVSRAGARDRAATPVVRVTNGGLQPQ